jgi:DNA polymerase I-like protein with 3'-5' exonuclease and polymerase domains|tara:strand:- start:5822 stop:7996 length:2175 start_codon:yes stop_codon:yes gene_type:complete
MITKTYTERKKKYKPLKLDDTCLRCGLFEHASSPKLARVKVQDGAAGKVLVVLGHPSQAEDIRGKIGGDVAGSTVKKYTKQYLEDCEVWMTTPVKCHPKDYIVKTHEVRWCSSLLKADLEELKPDKVIAMGELARMGCKELQQEYESCVHPLQLKDKSSDRTIIESYSRVGADLRDELYSIPLSTDLEEVIRLAKLEGFLGLDFEWNIETDQTHTVGFSSSSACIAVEIDVSIRKKLQELIQDKELTIVGHNIVVDVIRLIRLCPAIPIKCKFMDTLILKRQLASHLPKGGLKFFAHNYLHLVDYAKEITIEDFASSTQKLRDYCAGDAYAGIALLDMFKENYPKYWKIMKPARQIDMEMIVPVAHMINDGIKVDEPKLQVYAKENEALLDDIQARINEEHNINPSSPMQVLDTFKDLGIDIESTGETILKGVNHQFARDILVYRKHSKLHTTYTSKIPELVDAKGRLRCNLQLASTVTGRMTSTKPNMQNMPPGVRPCFKSIFEEEGTMLTVDASQSELRCLAYLSKSQYLIKSYADGVDMHTLVANLASVDRKSAKILNFAYIYGATDYRLTNELIKAGLKRAKAKSVVSKYLQVMSKIGIAKYQDKLLTSAKKMGYTCSVYGRIGDRLNPTQVVNFPIQSFSADLNKIRIIQMYKLLRENNMMSRIWLEFHDAMELDVYTPELPAVLKLIARVNTKIPDVLNYGIDLDLPLDIKNTGTNWQ